MLETRNVKKYFPMRNSALFARHEYIYALDDVSFRIAPGETVGLVGESGCGKTTLGRAVTRLYKPTSGQILFNGRDIAWIRGAELRAYRQAVQFIFQDPYSSLNPRKTVFDIVTTGLRSFGLVRGRAHLLAKAEELLSLVGLSAQYLNHYPHEFSGGQRQRLSIARSLAVGPKLVICDEPVSALDVSIQAQILNLLNELKGKLALSYLFISHDLSVVKHLSDRILVMYRGKIVEQAPTDALFAETAHPYSKALISAIPDPVTWLSKKLILKGDVSTPVGPVRGCCFADRCYMAEDVCRTEAPAERLIHPGHSVCCHFAEKVTG